MQKKIEKIACDESRLLPVDTVPTFSSVLHWYDEQRTDIEFGNLCTAILARLPPELSLPDERAEWLLRDIAAPRDPVDPQLRASLPRKNSTPKGAGCGGGK